MKRPQLLALAMAILALLAIAILLFARVLSTGGPATTPAAVELEPWAPEAAPVGDGFPVEAEAPGLPGAEDLDLQPRLVFQQRPVYPESMRERMQEAQVRVSLIVDADGSVREAGIVQSDHPAFEEPALAAARSFKFEPARLSGRSTRFQVEATIRFDPRRD